MPFESVCSVIEWKVAKLLLNTVKEHPTLSFVKAKREGRDNFYNSCPKLPFYGMVKL